MNTLTWKVTQLRITEAKPDFRERKPSRPTSSLTLLLRRTGLFPKTRSKTQTIHERESADALAALHDWRAQDVSFITPDKVHQCPQRQVTPQDGQSVQCACAPSTHSTRPSTLAKNVASKGSMQLSGMFLDDNKNPRSEPPHTSGAELDFGGGEPELLGAMFGEANATWGGTEIVDSDVEMTSVYGWYTARRAWPARIYRLSGCSR